MKEYSIRCEGLNKRCKLYSMRVEVEEAGKIQDVYCPLQCPQDLLHQEKMPNCCFFCINPCPIKSTIDPDSEDFTVLMKVLEEIKEIDKSLSTLK